MRFFIPSHPQNTHVLYWSWSRGHGLTCHYTNGSKCKSAWRLDELITATVDKGDGFPAIEVKRDEIPSTWRRDA